MNTSHTNGSSVSASSTPELLDVNAVARRLTVSERFVRRLVIERRIPYIKVGYFVRFDPRDVEQWVDEGRVAKES